MTSTQPEQSPRAAGRRFANTGRAHRLRKARGDDMRSNPLQVFARHPACYRLLMKRRALIMWTERMVRRLSKDRIGVLDLVGLPSLQITARGWKTGMPRTTPLQYVPDGTAFLVVGSNWGSAKHPAWSANLMAAHQVTVRRRDEQFTASVRMLTGVEREQAWHKVVDFWPNYEIAHELAAGRQFRLFILERIGSDPGE
jgi:deazaflavin-dependent oxidoreductase (nitroreductase family)